MTWKCVSIDWSRTDIFVLAKTTCFDTKHWTCLIFRIDCYVRAASSSALKQVNIASKMSLLPSNHRTNCLSWNSVPLMYNVERLMLQFVFEIDLYRYQHLLVLKLASYTFIHSCFHYELSKIKGKMNSATLLCCQVEYEVAIIPYWSVLEHVWSTR